VKCPRFLDGFGDCLSKGALADYKPSKLLLDAVRPLVRDSNMVQYMLLKTEHPALPKSNRDCIPVENNPTTCQVDMVVSSQRSVNTQPNLPYILFIAELVERPHSRRKNM